MVDETHPTFDGPTGSDIGSAHDLDALYDLLVDAAQAGTVFDLDGWVRGREHLRPQAERLARLAAGVTTPDDTRHPTPPGFTIIEEIGRGGMGVVYRARQHSPKRTVALKVTRAALASPSARRRFELETEFLARLEHPGIARIYAAGVDPSSGEPFFAMEFVEGQPLDDYAASRGLSTRERLDLVAQVCDAVEHAHQKGVVHRDLKPSNILVDREGHPRILDFGVARATDADVSITTLHTDVGALVGTIPYMSPEQAGGDSADIDTRSDVYALGVVAYKLLTGRLPYDIERKLVHEAVRIIREQDPTPMSSVNRTLGGDVQTIIAKALAKEKARRYQSASALGDDIRRYLHNEPISARPASAVYQLRTFARRNKAMVAGAAATILVLVAGIVATSWQAIAAIRARDRASANLALAESTAKELEQVAAFQQSQLSGILPGSMGTHLRDMVLDAAGEERRDSLKSGLALVNFTDIALGALDQNIFERALRAIDSEFADQPVIQARLLQAIAGTMRDLGLLDRALAPQSEALDMRRRVLGDDHADTLSSIRDTGVLLQAMGKHAEAEPFLREALERRRRVLGDDHPDTLTSMSDMGSLLNAQGNYAEAAPFYRAVLEKRKRQLGEEHPDTLLAINNMAYMLNKEGNRDDALLLYLESMEKRRRVLGDDHPDTLASMSNVGFLLQAQRKYAEAEPYYREVLEKRRRVLGEYHPDTLNSINNMGPLLWAQGKLPEAEPYYREALEKRLRTLGTDHPDTIISSSNLGVLLKLEGRYEEAEPLARSAMESSRRRLGEDHPNTLVFTTNLGDLLIYLHEYEEVVGLLEPIEPAVRAASKGATSRRLGLFLSNLGRARLSLGYDAVRFAQAERDLVEAHANLVAHPVPSPKDTIVCVQGLITLYTDWHGAEPGKGHDARASEWQATLDEMDSTGAN